MIDDNFFAIIDDNTLRRINLTQGITGSIRSVFIDGGAEIVDGRLEKVLFDGNYVIENDEVLYVELELPEFVKESSVNGIGIPGLDLKKEKIKVLFWVENGIYYFQNFDSRKLLSNRNVILFSNQTYSKLDEYAFILDNFVNAVFMEGKFFFTSYANANKIFSLASFYVEATNSDIESFSEHRYVAIEDKDWFLENSNTVIRKHVTLLQKSKILDGADTSKIRRQATVFKLKIDLDKKGKIVFPKEIKACKEILIFLNEQYYVGLITGNKYKTSSKRVV